MPETTAPLDLLLDVDPSLSGRIASLVYGRRDRFAVTAEEADRIRTLVPAGLVHLFRDGAETWVERPWTV